jgi:hypothetical protein
MRVWVYVEGVSDRLGLEALWTSWRDKLRAAGHGIRVIPLANKGQFFRKLGPHAAQKLVESPDDAVVGLPDLYPTAPFNSSNFAHRNCEELLAVQTRLVRTALRDIFSKNTEADTLLKRFHPSALKHDLEMLILAADKQLKDYTGARSLGQWRQPVEEQNQNRPPKYVVEEIFRTRSPKKRAYRDTVHAHAILRQVTDLREVLFYTDKQPKCPVFTEMLDWVGRVTDVPAYSGG